MRKPTSDQLARLPRWAQEHINGLHRQAEHMAAELQALKLAETESRTQWHRLSVDAPSYYLPDGAIIEFTLESEKVIRVYRDRTLNAVVVQADYMLVRPVATNKIEVG